MKRIVLHREAQLELEVSERFYLEQGGQELALSFLRHVGAAFSSIAQDPKRFPRLRKFQAVQKCRVSCFPFSIYYLESPSELTVIAIAHGKRQPGYWQQRLR